MRVIEVSEYETINIGLDELVVDGRLFIDPKIVGRGYLESCIRGANLEFRAGKFVGLIPLNANISIRVIPKVPVANLTKMLVESGEAARIISDFDGGYIPKLVYSPRSFEQYYRQFLDGASLIVRNGVRRSYVTQPDPPQWRGRLLPSETVKRFASRGIKYRAAFEFKTLSQACVENYAIREALLIIKKWLIQQRGKEAEQLEVRHLEAGLRGIPAWIYGLPFLARAAVCTAVKLPPACSYYRRGLWASIAILQSAIPDIDTSGYSNLDSMIIDMAAVFESYLRSIFEATAEKHDWRVINGNKNRLTFFSDNKNFDLKPDFIIKHNDRTAIFDAKYKFHAEEKDRYSLLAFMEGAQAEKGALILPQTESEQTSSYLGTTRSGKEMRIFRLDLKALDMEVEGRRLVDQISEFLSFH